MTRMNNLFSRSKLPMRQHLTRTRQNRSPICFKYIAYFKYLFSSLNIQCIIHVACNIRYIARGNIDTSTRGCSKLSPRLRWPHRRAFKTSDPSKGRESLCVVYLLRALYNAWEQLYQVEVKHINRVTPYPSLTYIHIVHFDSIQSVLSLSLSLLQIGANSRMDCSMHSLHFRRKSRPDILASLRNVECTRRIACSQLAQ